VNQTFHEPKGLSAWGILNYTRINKATINHFVGTLIKTCEKLGAVNCFNFDNLRLTFSLRNE
jgi:hypothetical protein